MRPGVGKLGGSIGANSGDALCAVSCPKIPGDGDGGRNESVGKRPTLLAAGACVECIGRDSAGICQRAADGDAATGRP